LSGFQQSAPRSPPEEVAGINTSRAYASPVAVVGLSLSVALSVILDVSNAATGVESLLAGLMASTATLVLDGTARAERRFRLRRMVESADWLPGAVAALAAASRRIVEDHPEPEIVREARRKLTTVTEDFEELARGLVTRPGRDYELLLAGTKACHRRLQAITNIPAGPDGLRRWWRGEIGRRYWAANVAALSRGVAITRVFVCDRVDPELAALIEEQREAGVTVLVAPRAGLDSTLHVNLVVWDGRRAWEPRMNAHGGIVGNVFTVHERDVERLTTAFLDCAAAAGPADG
jgi:hypothetical protein